MKNEKSILKLKPILTLLIIIVSLIPSIFLTIESQKAAIANLNNGVQKELDNSRSQNSTNYELPPDILEALNNLDADDWGYEEWKRYVIVDFCNHTEEEFYQNTKNDPQANHILDVLIRLLWGTYNGSLNEEESRILRSELTHNSVVISNYDIIRNDEIKLVIKLQYYVHSTWWSQYIAKVLEVRFRSKTNQDSQWFTTEGTDAYGYHRNQPQPNTVPFKNEFGNVNYESVYVIPGYPEESGVRVFHKYLSSVDGNVWDDKGTFYYETIEIITGWVEDNIYVHTIITSWKYEVGGLYWRATSRAKLISVKDDDEDPPYFEDFQACFAGDTLYDKVPGQRLYIFTDPNGDPVNDEDIIVRVNYSDQSGIFNKKLNYRFKGPSGYIYYEGPSIYDPNNDMFLIPKNHIFLIPGWSWHFRFGALATIEISSQATDADFDRPIPGNPLFSFIDSSTSPWTNDLYKTDVWDGWIVVAQVIKQDLTVETMNIQYEFSNALLEPYREYNPYPGEDIKFSLKLVNGATNTMQINKIEYAITSVELPTDPIYISQKLTNFEISGRDSNTTPFFGNSELLDQFTGIGIYLIHIIINYTLSSQDFLVNFEETIKVIRPECPEITYYIDDIELNSLALDYINLYFFHMFYKDMILNRPSTSEWKIKVENPSRLHLRLNDTLKFEIYHKEGKSPQKLRIASGSIIKISVSPLNFEIYTFTLEITNTLVFPPKNIILQILDLDILTYIKNVLSFGKKGFDFIRNYEKLIIHGHDVGKGISIANIVLGILTFFGDVLRLITTKTDLDLANIFNFKCLTKDTSWNYTLSDGEIKFSELHVNLINTTKLNFDVFTQLSHKQYNYVEEYLITQTLIVILDACSVGTGIYALKYAPDPITKAGAALLSLHFWVDKEIFKAEREEYKRLCEDPEPPAGDFTKSVKKNYTEAVLPREFENNLRYSSCLINLLQSVENLRAEREAQQEIINRMNYAIDSNETEWAIFQLNDLRKSIKLETLYTNNYIDSLKKYNSLYSEDLLSLCITNEDLILVEQDVKENGIPSELKQLINFSEEREKELITHITNISNILDVHDPSNDYSYLEYNKEIDMDLEGISESNTEVYIEICDLIVEETVDLSIKGGKHSYKLNETDIISLESLNQSISEKIVINEWDSVIEYCNQLIELTNNLTLKTFNSSHPIILSYKYYAQRIKREALENNRRHLFISSPDFNRNQALEPETIEKAKIYIKLVNASTPNKVELAVHNLLGSHRFLDENGAVITQITLIPNITSTLFLEYSFNENVDYSTQVFDVIFRELNYNTYYHKKVVVNLVEDADTTPPIILIDYIGGNKSDGNPGAWDVFAYDRESIINNNTIEIYINDSLVGNSFGVYNVPVILGNHTITVGVWNNDLTHPEFAWKNKSVIIKDDDVGPPEISNLIIIPDIFEINISFTAKDYSGINEIKIFINNDIAFPISYNQIGNTYCYTLENKWLFEEGYSEVKIQIVDADNDRPDDSLSSFINETFKNVLWDMYEYVGWQLEELKNFIENALDFKWKRCLIYKLTKAQENLGEAFDLIQTNNITQGLCHDFIAKIYLRITEIKTELLNRKNWIPDEIADYIITALHGIRDNIVFLMGASTGSELAYGIVYLEVDLLNLKDYIEEELPYCVGKYLGRKIWCASKLLEIAIFKISKDEEIDCLLWCARWKLEWTICKIDCLLGKGRISETHASYLKGEILEIITKIESL